MNNVVITGLGAVTPIGNNVQEFIDALYLGKSGAELIKRFPYEELPTKIAAEVKNFSSPYRDIKISFALEAAKEAMNQAFPQGLTQIKSSSLSIGLGLELFSMEDLGKVERGQASVEEKKLLTFLSTPSDLCCHLISKQYQFDHAPLIHISACASSTDAIGSAYQQIKRGKRKMVLAGGADSMINPMGVAGFCRIGAMSKKNDRPQTASSPFDRERDGFLLGEGAAFLVLEEEANAIARGAKILGRICGYGNSLDAYSISDPHPEGNGAYESMNRALSDAGIKSEQIDAISCHGTGTPKNDPAEAKAIRKLFQNSWQKTPVFTTKSLIGHLISAAGAVEVVASIKAMQNSKLHATMNLKNVDVDCELNHVIGNNLEKPLNYIMKNSFGFGGQNASLVIGKN